MKKPLVYYHKIKNKDELVSKADEWLEDIKAGNTEEKNRSIKSHFAYVEFVEKFINRLKRSEFPEGFTDRWGYCLDITDMSANVWLELLENISDDSLTIKEAYNIVSMKPEMLTVEEYAQLHETSVGTVRQWIRRGKLRKAEKLAKEWRIPKFEEPNVGKYQPGVFRWDKNVHDLPDEFEFINDFHEACIKQVNADEYLIGLLLGINNEKKIVSVTAKERERIELAFISDPYVKCSNGCLNFDFLKKRIEEQDKLSVDTEGK